jgi:hypothetical protein
LLRNAAGHSQYRWDGGDEKLIDLRTGAVWTLGELEDRMHALAAAVTGAEAGYCAFLVDQEVDLDPPAWLRTGEAPAAVQLLAEAMLGAYGFEVMEVSSTGGELVIGGGPKPDALRLLPPLAGLVAVIVNDESCACGHRTARSSSRWRLKPCGRRRRHAMS